MSLSTPWWPPEPYWSIPEAAARFGMCPKALRRRIDRGDIVAIKAPGAAGWLIAEAELCPYAAAQSPVAVDDR